MSRTIYDPPIRTKSTHPSMRKHSSNNDLVAYLVTGLLFVLILLAIYT